VRLFSCAILVVFVFVAGLSPALAEKRIALVIGNSNYVLISPLANPANDAALMTEALKGAGFEVVERVNADQLVIKRAIRDFGKKLRAAGADAVGLFYYAGHGIQADGANYLIPVNAPVEDEADLEIEAVSGQWVLGQMESAGNALNIVILDACRNNPFKRSFRSATRGLARMDAPSGSLIAYSAGPGRVAADGYGSNSPYTMALAAAMREPGLDLEDVFKRVRVAVEKATAENQTPWEESSLKGDFYFVPLVLPSTVNVETPASQQPAPPAPGSLAATAEMMFWNAIQDSADPRMFDAYLEQFPTGTFATLARLNADRLRDAERPPPALEDEPEPTRETEAEVEAEVDVALVVTAPPKAAFEVASMDETLVAVKNANVRDKPSTEGNAVGRLPVESPVEVTGKLQDRNWYRIAYEGQVAYVYAPLLEAIDLEELSDWQVVKNSKQTSAFEGFLEDHPEGYFAGRAKTQLAALTSPPKPAPASPSVQPAVGIYPEGRKSGDGFKDCAECPEMVVIPPGRFRMGDLSGGGADFEKPAHAVTIGYEFAVGKYEVTRGEFAAFVKETGYDVGGGCWYYNGKKWKRSGAKNWRSPGIGQSDLDPAVCVSWDDAKAYLQWLGGKAGVDYRLLSEAEWEYVARAGTTSAYNFGASISKGQAKYGSLDGTVGVGSYKPNTFGLYDLHGNAWEWTEDCWSDNYSAVPADGSAWLRENCRFRVLRGGSWITQPKSLRSAFRDRNTADDRINNYGFRVARML
jgi:formylglycine-generating enzyme required for sulfatase activity